jgi:protein gp37
VGVSATNAVQATSAYKYLPEVEARVKFVSLEPLLYEINPACLPLNYINWLIIGQQTPVSAKTAPKIEWIREIVEAGDKAGIPIFEKNNLKSLLINEKGHAMVGSLLLDRVLENGTYKLRQEFPRLENR